MAVELGWGWCSPAASRSLGSRSPGQGGKGPCGHLQEGAQSSRDVGGGAPRDLGFCVKAVESLRVETVGSSLRPAHRPPRPMQTPRARIADGACSSANRETGPHGKTKPSVQGRWARKLCPIWGLRELGAPALCAFEGNDRLHLHLLPPNASPPLRAVHGPQAGTESPGPASSGRLCSLWL